MLSLQKHFIIRLKKVGMLSGVNKNQHEMSTGHYEKAHVHTKILKKKQKLRQIRHHDRLLSNQ